MIVPILKVAVDGVMTTCRFVRPFAALGHTPSRWIAPVAGYGKGVRRGAHKGMMRLHFASYRTGMNWPKPPAFNAWANAQLAKHPDPHWQGWYAVDDVYVQTGSMFYAVCFPLGVACPRQEVRDFLDDHQMTDRFDYHSGMIICHHQAFDEQGLDQQVMLKLRFNIKTK